MAAALVKSKYILSGKMHCNKTLIVDSFIVGAKRTVFGTYGGKLKHVSLSDLQTIAAKAALASANVKPEAVDSVIVGVVGSVSDLPLSHCRDIKL